MIMKKLILSAIILLSTNGASAQEVVQGQNLTINVSGAKVKKGQIMLAVCRQDEFLKSGCTFAKIIKVTDLKNKIVVFENLPANTYAVQMFHDLNNDGKLGANFMGIPNEPIGFSNDAKIKFGPPKFEDAAIVFNKSTSINMILH